MRRFVGILGFFVFLCLARNVSAFQVGKIESGMPQNLALEALKREGFKVNEKQLNEGMAVAVRDNAYRILSFCDARVVSYSFGLAGGANAFIKVVKDETSRRGAGEYEASSIQSDRGEINSLKVTWPNPEGEYSVSYTPATKGIAESLSAYHAVKNPCKKR